MKTKFFLAMGLLVIAGIVCGQNESRQNIETEQETKVKNTIDSGHFQMVMAFAQPMGMKYTFRLNFEYSLALQGDSAIANLPYYGISYSIPLANNEGGIKFSEPVKEKQMVFNEKKKRYTIKFNVRNSIDSYHFVVTIWLSGKASIYVSSSNRQPISFTGQLDLPEE